MKKIFLYLGLVILGLGGLVSFQFYQEIQKASSQDPTVWEEDIIALETKTRAMNPPAEAVLFVGSSSIRLWDTLAKDMAPIPVIQHGFGGAKIGDVVHYADRLINHWNPEKVVIFAGTNDINLNDHHSQAPAHIAEQLKNLLEKIIAARADTQIFYIAITPTLYSWEKWDSVQEANRRAELICDEYEQVTFIATEELFLSEENEPIKELFVFDGLHLSEQGYERWTGRIKPLLLTE